ncbi:hypothetical protein ACWDTI_05935 [Gordonia sp. NPDC003424]
MLTLALAATLVGFVLLVLGLITGTLWLAIACIVVCLIGLAFLIADILRGGRRRKERTLADFVGTGSSSNPATGDASAPGQTATTGAAGAAAALGARHGRHEAPEPEAADAPSEPVQTADADVPDAGADDTPLTPATTTGEFRAADGTLDDYLRSVGADVEAPEGTPPEHAESAEPDATDQTSHGDSSPGEASDDRSSTQRFDPLDPNWRPPVD